MKSSELFAVCILFLLIGVAGVIGAICTRPDTIEMENLPFNVSVEFWEANTYDVVGYKNLRSKGHYIYKVNGCTPDELPVIINILQKPETMTFDSVTNLLEWYPTVQEAGHHWLTIKVTADPPEGCEIEEDVVSIVLRVRRYRRPWFQSLKDVLVED